MPSHLNAQDSGPEADRSGVGDEALDSSRETSLARAGRHEDLEHDNFSTYARVRIAAIKPPPPPPRLSGPSGLAAEVSPKRTVGFSGVTGVSRPVNNEEHWILYYFEAHVDQCRDCEDPLQVSEYSRQLCDEGHQLAIDVIEVIVRKKDEVYSRTKANEQDVRIEIPHGYEQSISLLKAVQRASKRKERFRRKSRKGTNHTIPEAII